MFRLASRERRRLRTGFDNVIVIAGRHDGGPSADPGKSPAVSKVPYNRLNLGVPKETWADEKRVALVPNSVELLRKHGWNVRVENGAGFGAKFRDGNYEIAGAQIVSKENAFAADVILKVRHPVLNEIPLFKDGSTLVSYLYPAINRDLIKEFAKKKYERFRQITAVGKLPPAKVFVIGGGVAGLAAIAQAKNMGAVVRAFDTRFAVKEQVESLGAQFLTVSIQEDGSTSGGYSKQMSKEFIQAEMELFSKQMKEVDIVISTALIPGKPAPKLILKEHIELMKPGSVVVDLAAEAGGNIETTRKLK